ncbi:MAG: hypothetical protein AAF750_08405 [Planctomycetota bacterium]
MPDQEPDQPPPLLNQFLAQTDTPCPLCGYNLRALTSDACPECGEPLRLSVTLREPKLLAYLATLTAWAIGAGASVFLCSIAVVAPAPRSWWESLAGRSVLVMALLSTICFIILAWKRRAFCRIAMPKQKAVAVCSWTLVTTLAIIIVVNFDG